MSTLEYTMFRIRQGWRGSSIFLFAGAFAAIFVLGSFRNFWHDTASKVSLIILFAIWAVVFGLKAHRRFSNYKTTKPMSREREDLELGLLLVVATYAVVQLAGGLGSLFYPMVFVLVALLVIYTSKWVGFTLVASAIGIELTLYALRPGNTGVHEVVVHAAFIIFFALFNLVFTRMEIVRVRQQSERAMQQAKTAMADDARDFRLIAPASKKGWRMSREEEEARLSCSSMSQVQGAMFHHLDLLKRTMGLNTSAVLWLNSTGDKLRVRECVSDTENIMTKPFHKGDGAIGAVLQSRKPMRLSSLRPGYTGLTYYAESTDVTDFAGVPIIESECLRGVLCADRTDERRFTDAEIDALEASVESLLNTVANERVFNQLQKAKSEQSKLLSASEALSKNLAEKDVVRAALDAAAEIVPYDVGVVALVDSKERQVICHAIGPRAEELENQNVSGSATLASVALKNRHYLPYRGELDPRQQIIFSKSTQKVFAKMRSAMVLPLAQGDTLLGTLTLASEKASQFDEEVRTTLQVMTHQLGTVLQNARMYKRLEELATTDGLTGLPNHRVFQEELEKKLASAARFEKELSIIFCDVDKFKGVNDTYGHPVGDMVLKGLAGILKRIVVRDTDLPARYGGEEFGVVCEGTDTKGAVQLAERIRQDLAKEVFRTEQGELHVTISMGVATYPIHAVKKEDLLKRADTALYAAKEGGRNQVRVWEIDMAG